MFVLSLALFDFVSHLPSLYSSTIKPRGKRTRRHFKPWS